MDPELGQAVREAAAQSGMSVSRWMNDAAEARLRNHLLGAALDAFEAENGPFSEEELEEARKLLGVGTSKRRKAS
jgi:hypothetical protein